MSNSQNNHAITAAIIGGIFAIIAALIQLIPMFFMGYFHKGTPSSQVSSQNNYAQSTTSNAVANQNSNNQSNTSSAANQNNNNQSNTSSVANQNNHAQSGTNDQVLKIEVSTDRGKDMPVYWNGENLCVKLLANQDCFAHVYLCEKTNVATRIYPNQHNPSAKLIARQGYWIPPMNSVFTLEIECTNDKDVWEIRVYASKNPLPEISGKSLPYGMKCVEYSKLAKHYSSNDIQKENCKIINLIK